MYYLSTYLTIDLERNRTAGPYIHVAVKNDNSRSVFVVYMYMYMYMYYYLLILLLCLEGKRIGGPKPLKRPYSLCVFLSRILACGMCAYALQLAIVNNLQ